LELKDYYKILNLEPSATHQEIKKAFRKLAQHFHPDKNSNNQYAHIHFAEIKEAYETLINPSLKNEYLQQRWYQQSLGKKNLRHQPVTPPVLLKQFLVLDKQVATLDSFRMDKNALFRKLEDLLGDENRNLLKQFNEQHINHEIIRTVLRMAGHLRLHQVEWLKEQLLDLCNPPDRIEAEINAWVSRYKIRNRWDRYKAVIIIVTTLLISVLIYFTSR
jgi:curved DNA-binding protein CbpA